MSRRRWLPVGLAGAVFVSALFHLSQASWTKAFAVEADGPLSVVAAIYKEDMKASGTDWATRKGRPRYLTSALSTLWNRAEDHAPKNDELGMFDFDLASDTNGLTLAGYDPRIEKQSPDAATIAVTLRYKEKGQRAGLVRYDVIRENGAWKVDEMRTKSWSLRNILKLNLKTP